MISALTHILRLARAGYVFAREGVLARILLYGGAAVLAEAARALQGTPAVHAALSDLKLQAYGLDREEILRRVRDAVSYAVENGITVCYFGVDGTRADRDFLRRAYETGLEAGATEIAVVDTLSV